MDHKLTCNEGHCFAWHVRVQIHYSSQAITKLHIVYFDKYLIINLDFMSRKQMLSIPLWRPDDFAREAKLTAGC